MKRDKYVQLLTQILKKGDIIRCKDEQELKEILSDLSAAGFHAVHDSVYNVPQIIITAVPE